LLIFTGITTLMIGAPAVAQANNYQPLWPPVIGLIIFLFGLVVQRFSTPVPLAPVTATPPGWPWFFAAVIVAPWLLGWIDWHGPWFILLVLIAATIGGWASFMPVYRRTVIQQQYREDTASEIASTENAS
jgi:hypothetical protein